jgi:hypothetical protein
MEDQNCAMYVQGKAAQSEKVYRSICAGIREDMRASNMPASYPTPESAREEMLAYM